MEMSEANPQQSSKNWDVIIDFLAEMIGYEQGLHHTFVALRKQPQVVLENYLSKTHIYVGPFKILISIVTVWLLFNNLIVDWYKIIGEGLTDYTNYLWFNIQHKTEPIPASLLKINGLFAKIFADLFSKYYMVFVVFGTPLWAYICLKLCKPYKIDFRTHLAVVGYHFSLGFIAALVFIIGLAIHPLLCVALAFIFMLSPFIGLKVIYNKFFAIVPVSAFFEHDGPAIEKKYFQARLIATMIFLLIYGICWWVYYLVFPFTP